MIDITVKIFEFSNLQQQRDTLEAINNLPDRSHVRIFMVNEQDQVIWGIKVKKVNNHWRHDGLTVTSTHYSDNGSSPIMGYSCWHMLEAPENYEKLDIASVTHMHALRKRWGAERKSRQLVGTSERVEK